jgi:hypothetical protein
MSSLDIDPRQLVRWLGVDGARAGLLQSKRITIDVLRKIASNLNLKLPEKTTRQQFVDEIISLASRRIDKSLDELFSMDHRELLEYFDRIDVEPSEVLDILKELNLKPRKESRKNILEFAARELSETGRFMRIAGKTDEQSADFALRR